MTKQNNGKSATNGNATAGRYYIFGHSVTSVIRWMGSQGWSFEDARKTLARLGAQAVDDKTIRYQLYDGAGRKAGKPPLYNGPIAGLTPNEVKKLDNQRRKAQQVVKLKAKENLAVSLNNRPRREGSEAAAIDAYIVNQKGQPFTSRGIFATLGDNVRLGRIDDHLRYLMERGFIERNPNGRGYVVVSNVRAPAASTMKPLEEKPTKGRPLPLKDGRDVQLLWQAARSSRQRRLHNRLTNTLKKLLEPPLRLQEGDNGILFDVLVSCYNATGDDLLIEAKSSIEDAHIRMAIGQLYDYSFSWFRRKNEAKPHLAILTPEKPRGETIELLNWLGIGVLWIESGSLRTCTDSLNSLCALASK